MIHCWHAVVYWNEMTMKDGMIMVDCATNGMPRIGIGWLIAHALDQASNIGRYRFERFEIIRSPNPTPDLWSHSQETYTHEGCTHYYWWILARQSRGFTYKHGPASHILACTSAMGIWPFFLFVGICYGISCTFGTPSWLGLSAPSLRTYLVLCQLDIHQLLHTNQIMNHIHIVP